MNHDEAMSFCEKWLPLWTGNRPEPLAQIYAPDAFYRDPAKADGIQGRERLLLYFKKLLAPNPAWIWEMVEVFPTDQGFNLKWKATIPTRTGTLIEYGMDIVEVRDGLITRNEVYFDRAAFLKALT